MTDLPVVEPLDVRIDGIQMTNFLSYRSATIDLDDDLVALVGPNASGKSNAVSALKLLREIAYHGLPTAIARRGGFDQLRHRSRGRPYDPSLRLDFTFAGAPQSFYGLKLSAVAGKRYRIKEERGSVHLSDGRTSNFVHADGVMTWTDVYSADAEPDRRLRVPSGQSAITSGGVSYAVYVIAEVLRAIQTVEINPTTIGELQDPSSTHEFEPDGSNAVSVYESLTALARAELVDELSAIVPGIARIEVRRLADKVTLAFVQETGRGRREFLAKQMSDGTLRAFGILLALMQDPVPILTVVEEPEVAIHLGALQTLVDIFQQQSSATQILLTTHSADIIDTLDIRSLRVVWSERGESRIAPVAAHSVEPVRRGLITPGELLRSDALDPAVA